MRNHISKLMALLLLVGVAQTLTACVFEDDHDRRWHDEHHDDEHHDHDDHHWDDRR